MAEHSTLYILRKRHDSIEIPQNVINEEKTKLENQIKSSNLFSSENVSIPNYVFKSENYEMLSFKDKSSYSILFETGFCSTFTCIREEFYLNSYSNSEFEIDYNMAKEMRQALNYLLSFNYSDDIEEIMDNKYIEILGHNLPIYEYRKLPPDPDNTGEDYFDIEGKCALKRLKTTLDTFLSLCDEDVAIYTGAGDKYYRFDYKLLYVCD